MSGTEPTIAQSLHSQPHRPPSERHPVVKILVLLAEPAVAFALALLVGGIGITLFSGLVPGHDPFDYKLAVYAYWQLIQGVIGQGGAASTLVYATPLILAGLGVAIGFKAGLFNIGGRGQFLLGSVGAMAVVTMIGAQAGAIVTIPLALLGGALLGGVGGFVPGVLKATRGAHEVVTTIMLNYIFVFVTYWAISGPLSLPRSPQPITADVGTINGALPNLGALPIISSLPDLSTVPILSYLVSIGSIHIGVLVALLAVPLIWFLLFRTTIGFEIRAAGANADAARYGGMRTNRLIVMTMSLAGFMCGLAGAVTLLGVVHQMAPGYDTTIGFDAITVALLGRSNPIGVFFAGLLLGALRAGAQVMQIQAGVPAELVDALQAIILLFLVVNILRRFMAGRSRRRPAMPAVTTPGTLEPEAAQ